MKKRYVILNAQVKNELRMHVAKEQDSGSVMNLLVDTARWFNENGSTQWSGLLEGIDTHHTKEAIKRGDVFVCKDGEVISGMVMLLQRPSEWDAKLWERHNKNLEQSIYLHRLAVHRNYANQQLGAAILKWCLDNVQFEGKTNIRLDCMANNEFLNAFYKKEGFTYIGESEGYSLYEAAL